MTKSPIAQTQGDSELGSCVDEAVCSHFCHISAHMVGIVSQKIHVSAANMSSSYLPLNESFHSLTISPPSQPPKA